MKIKILSFSRKPKEPNIRNSIPVPMIIDTSKMMIMTRDNLLAFFFGLASVHFIETSRKLHMKGQTSNKQLVFSIRFT